MSCLVRSEGLHKTTSYLDIPKEILADYADKIRAEIVANDLTTIDNLLEEISELPISWQIKFIERGSIYPELFPQVGHHSDGEILDILALVEKYNFQTSALTCLKLVLKVMSLWKAQGTAAPSR